LATLGAVHPAHAQLTPDHTYYGINHPMSMKVAIPKEARAAAVVPAAKAEDATGDATGNAKEPTKPASDPSDAVIELYAWDDTRPASSAHVVEGGIDLAAVFPELWTATPRLLYAQLKVGETKIGSPVVLQPMVTPRKAQLFNAQTRQAWFVDPKTGKPNYDARKECELSFPTPAAHYSGIRAYCEQHVVFTTSEGAIEFKMRPDQAPNTVNNLLDLVRGGFYTDTIVHRVVPKLPATGYPFVVQFGDPTGTGDGGPGYNIDLEASSLQHDFGVLSMARDDDPDTNGSQVFICLSREGTSRLDGRYTAFGQAVKGAQTILALGSVKTDEQTQRPLTPPKILRATLIPAPCFGEGPSPVRRPAAAER
jgi:peptidyl-prolyl cis-trans isomerase B (cyclophilin B)